MKKPSKKNLPILVDPLNRIPEPTLLLAASVEAMSDHAKEKELDLLAGQLIAFASAALNKYLEAVQFIRYSKLTPKTVRKILADRGFPPARISELLKVAYCPLAIWQDYLAQKIGFKVVLERTRELENPDPETALRLRYLELTASLFKLVGKHKPEKPLQFTHGGWIISIRRGKRVGITTDLPADASKQNKPKSASKKRQSKKE